MIKQILIVNDDGITSPGIEALVSVAREYGEVTVVAPDKPQSAMGHAITIGKPLRLQKVHPFGNEISSYQCSGTPVDCVKLAVGTIYKGKPDICLSGINHGSNASINIIYSGTMSAAMEAALEGIPSVGFSLLDYQWDADFSLAKKVVEDVLQLLLTQKSRKNTLWNVNIPSETLKKYKGLKICRQAKAKWEENFVARLDPHGKKYYWLTGEFKNYDKGRDTDIYALEKGYASLVPIQWDLTDHNQISTLENSIAHVQVKK
jgi:5'-nucleotidase